VKHHEGGEIFTIDDAEGTVYVLLRPGEKPVMAHWPHHLLTLAPDARMMGTLGGEEWHVGLNGQLAHMYGGRVYTGEEETLF